MSTRLIQVLTFTNVAPAATVIQAHQINVNGTATRPDLVAADASGFTITADATQVSVTNNNPDPTTVHVWLERKHTTPRQLGALANLSPQPFVFAAGGGGGGGSAAVFQWNVGVPWATVYAAMAALTGPKICLVEYDPATNGDRTVTNNGGVPQDFNNILFVGLSGAPSDGTTATLVFDDGIQFAPGPQGVRLASQDVGWDFSALTSAAFVATSPTTWTTFNMTGGRLDGSATAGVGVFDGTLWLLLRDVHAGGGNVGRCTDGTDELWLRAGTRVFNPIFIDDGNGNGLAVFADASCQWSRAGLIANGLYVSPMEVINYAQGPGGNSLYSISVDGGGNVIATLVP